MKFFPLVALLMVPDGKINFYSYYLKEKVEVRYRAGDHAEKLFRSRDSDAVHPIDPRLLELIDRIEDHFGVRQVEIISGYRSPVFNKELKKEGHNVANESYHTKGMAADIHLDEITEEAVRDYAESLGMGGVGYYPALNMVHVDVGPVRRWSEAGPRKTWVGEKNPNVPLLMTVTPERSFKKKIESVTIVQEDPAHPVVVSDTMDIEFFDRGKWKVVETMPLKDYRKNLENLPYGKFRLKIGSQYSNEFYFKKI